MKESLTLRRLELARFAIIFLMKKKLILLSTILLVVCLFLVYLTSMTQVNNFVVSVVGFETDPVPEVSVYRMISNSLNIQFFVDRSGQRLNDADYDLAGAFREGLARVVIVG
mgnify:CR=1 FL=1